MLETGIGHVHETIRASRKGGPLRILWSGALITRKALSLLIKALARLPRDMSYELRVLGDGPLRARYERLACRMGVSRNITWLGWRPHSEALEQYPWADIFVFTSLRETTGTVVLEAIACGLPIVYLDHQGVHDILGDDCGVGILVSTPAAAVVHLSEAIAALARDPRWRERLANGALQRARRFTWNRRGRELSLVYKSVLGGDFDWQPRRHADPL
jgi:glycosyltransferase involved in cell wall biosynthesis